jgi:hypothetical protein
MVRLIASSAAICLIAGSSVAQSSTDKGPRGDTLNPEDCKVMATLGQDLLNWDKVTPTIFSGASVRVDALGGRTETIAFIGPGNLGSSIATNLLKAVYSRTASKADPLVSLGARRADRPARGRSTFLDEP